MPILSLATTARKRSAIGLTSLIDVVFILLLFFMLSSTFSPIRALDINPATQGAGELSSKEKPLVISVVDAKHWRIDGVSMTHSESVSILARAITENATVLVRAEGAASVQALVSALSFLAGQGVRQLNVGKALADGGDHVQ